MNPQSSLWSVLMLPVIGGLFPLLASSSKFSERGVGPVLPEAWLLSALAWLCVC